MAQNIPSAKELRAVARYLEEAAADVAAAVREAPPPLAIGGAQSFPREAPEDRGAPQETGVVLEETARAVATLQELAAAITAGADVPPALLAPVQAHIDAYRAAHP